MLALRLTRAARPAVQLRRLLVVAASAGTGFLLLCALGHALAHPAGAGGSALRLAWCAAPLAATVYLALAVARTDPGTRPRGGLFAAGLGPGRLRAVSAATTAASCALGSLLALLLFLLLRGDLTGRPAAGPAAGALAVGLPLPLPAVLTLLALVPAAASASVALSLRPREAARTAPTAGTGRRYGRFGAYGLAARETFGAYGRFGARRATARAAASGRAGAGTPGAATAATPSGTTAAASGQSGDGTSGHTPGATAAIPTPGATATALGEAALVPALADGAAPVASPGSRPATGSLPWGVAVLAAGLAMETTLADRSGGTSAGVLSGWALTALGLALAGPGLTHLCGRLLQAVRPGAVRLLAGRVLMAEAQRIGRPLGVVCAVASAAYAAASAHGADAASFGPLRTLGAVLVAGCAVATLLTTAVEAKQARAAATAALLRLGAPAGVLRGAAVLRAAVLPAVFGPLTLAVAQLAALPLARS
ncbi:hypothetical protein AB0E75_22085 [Streptomyces griseoviridis]|uniref:Uncharacterized protein n=1 Tax=Streptomyces griseoviridis TaxID=45398 RepID=A0A918LKK4_STRGD|nr:hypothetical protein [Streptomyces niveoruber]GGS61461.1 hypothetical protein GCM10010238_58190 [Streptomyces niveoruber]